ncbi:MAG: MarR family transcriptional regulator [Candidatus Dormiibacterota bacterium]
MLSSLQPALKPSIRLAWRAYIDAVTLAESVQQQLWSDAHLTLTQLRVLGKLREGPLPVNQIGRALGVSAASMTRILDRLEERRLVSRRRVHEDRRRVEIHLEPKGRQFMTQLRPFQGTPIERALQAMSEEERLAFVSALRKLVDLARELTEDEQAATPAR